MQDHAMVQQLAEALYNKKARDIIALDVSGLTVICDYMLISTGRSVPQVQALADEVEEAAEQMKLPCAAPRAETRAAGWSWTTGRSSFISSIPRSAPITTWNACGRTVKIGWCFPSTKPRPDAAGSCPHQKKRRRTHEENDWL